MHLLVACMDVHTSTYVCMHERAHTLTDKRMYISYAYRQTFVHMQMGTVPGARWHASVVHLLLTAGRALSRAIFFLFPGVAPHTKKQIRF